MDETLVRVIKTCFELIKCPRACDLDHTLMEIRDIMDRELSHTEIKKFLSLNGLDIDLLDERGGNLEAWRHKWEGLAKGFLNYLQDRFASIEHRLDRLEDRHRHQTD